MELLLDGSLQAQGLLLLKIIIVVHLLLVEIYTRLWFFHLLSHGVMAPHLQAHLGILRLLGLF
jgi:hypothetical protein